MKDTNSDKEVFKPVPRIFWAIEYCDGDGYGGGFRIIWLGFFHLAQDRSYEKWYRGWSIGLNKD